MAAATLKASRPVWFASCVVPVTDVPTGYRRQGQKHGQDRIRTEQTRRGDALPERAQHHSQGRRHTTGISQLPKVASGSTLS